MKITVTEKHLETSLAQVVPGKIKGDYCAKCVVGIAVSEAFPADKVSVSQIFAIIDGSYHTIAGAEGIIDEFDRGSIEKVRAMLPSEITLTKIEPVF